MKVIIKILIIFFLFFSFKIKAEEIYLSCKFNFLRFTDNKNSLNNFIVTEIKDIPVWLHEKWIILNLNEKLIWHNFNFGKSDKFQEMTIDDIDIYWSGKSFAFDQSININRITGNMTFSERHEENDTLSYYMYLCDTSKNKKF